jgi:hypothetical protein
MRKFLYIDNEDKEFKEHKEVLEEAFKGDIKIYPDEQANRNDILNKLLAQGSYDPKNINMDFIDFNMYDAVLIDVSLRASDSDLFGCTIGELIKKRYPKVVVCYLTRHAKSVQPLAKLENVFTKELIDELIQFISKTFELKSQRSNKKNKTTFVKRIENLIKASILVVPLFLIGLTIASYFSKFEKDIVLILLTIAEYIYLILLPIFILFGLYHYFKNYMQYFLLDETKTNLFVEKDGEKALKNINHTKILFVNSILATLILKILSIIVEIGNIDKKKGVLQNNLSDYYYLIPHGLLLLFLIIYARLLNNDHKH